MINRIVPMASPFLNYVRRSEALWTCCQPSPVIRSFGRPVMSGKRKLVGMPLKPPIPPMEARSVDEIPTGDGWQYEPKWDGFRCLAFRDGDKIFLQSKNGQPLARYFPDVAANVAKLAQQRFVLDGELVIPVGGALSFDELQLRLASCREPRSETGCSSSSRLHRVRSACGERRTHI